MNDQTPAEETAQNVTELPKAKRQFDWKKYAKYAAYGTAAVVSAVVIFKLAAADATPEELEFEPTSDEDTNVA